MKFSVLLSSFNKQLQEVCSIAAGSSNKDEDVTQNIFLSVNSNILSLKASNYNLEMIAEIPVTEVDSEGEVLVNANKLRETLSSLEPSSMVSFTLDDEKNILNVADQASTLFEIRARSTDGFPSFEVEDVEQTIVLQQKQLKTIIDTSTFCVSNDDFRDYLKGVRIELNGTKLEVFTTDAHRMCILETNLENQSPATKPFGAIITKKCADALSKIITDGSENEVKLEFTKNAVLTSCNGYKLASILINCAYPNVRAVIPKQIDEVITVPKAEFVAALRKASVLSSKRVNAVTLNFRNDMLYMRSENSEHEVSSAELHLSEAAATPVEISLNAKYLRDVFSAMKSENVRFCFSQPLLNVLIKPQDDVNENEIITSYIISKVVV